MEIRVLIGAVKDRLGAKRKMSEVEAELENQKRALAASEDYVSNKRKGAMPKTEWAKAGVTDAKDEYMTDRAMRNKASKNLADKMKEKESN